MIQCLTCLRAGTIDPISPTMRFPALALLILALAAGNGLQGQPYALSSLVDASVEGPVYEVPIEGMVDSGLSRYLARALSDAQSAGASVVIFRMDTFGGLVAAADEIVQTLLAAKVPTVTFIDKNAASAGALIALATDRIVMVPGASIGAATVVDGVGGEAAPDKYQSYMRGQMRSVAEAKGRNPRVAEAMVDDRIVIEGVIKEGEVLTLTPSEAVKLGMADAEISSIEEVLEALGLADRPVVQHRATTAESILRLFGSPVLQSILMLMMMGGLYFEFQTPGVGFPGAMAAIGAVLFFAPNYMLGYVEGWEVVLFLMGIILLIIEFILIPGFGVAGISGLVLIVVSLLFSLIQNVGFEFPDARDLSTAILTMAATLTLLVVLGFSLGRFIPRSGGLGRLVLQPDLASGDGYTSADSDDTLMGKQGVALSMLRPSGIADIEGRRIDVVTRGEFIAAGTPVVVMDVRGSRVEVRAEKDRSVA